jgi:hypothetical protein
MTTSHNIRWLALAIVLFAMALASTASARTTEVSRFEPFDEFGDVDPSLQMSTRYGDCWVGSLTTRRADAWRCMAGHYIYDPCFDSPDADFVVCPRDPWNGRAVRLYYDTLPERYRNGPGHNSDVWAIKLFNGRKCFFASGASDVIGGVRVNYFCSSNYALVGSPKRSRKPWRIPMVRYPAKRQMRSVAIRSAWE